MTALPLYIIFAINIVTSIVKRWIFPKWGAIGTQVFAFGLALIGAVYWTYSSQVPGLEAIVASAIGLFSLAVTFYEVILQHIPLFKGPALEE